MRVERFGSAQIFRWSRPMELRMRAEAREHLLGRFAVGEYRDAKTINSILQHLFAYYAKQLTEAVRVFADRDSFEFILTHYDEANKILHGHGIEDPDERIRWLRIEGNYRRALKYLAELITLEAPSNERSASRVDAHRAMDKALLAADMVIDLAEGSNCVHCLFPDTCLLKIHPIGGLIDWEFRVVGPLSGYSAELLDRLVRDRQARAEFLEGPQFDHHTESHVPILNPAFKKVYGCDYAHFIWVLYRIVDDSRAAQNSFPTLFINRAAVVSQFVQIGLSIEVVDRILKGFTVYPENMRNEGRVVWNPKQEHRALRRGFFSFPHETGEHLAFSREMAREGLMHLVHGVCYKRLPIEWQHPEISPALEELSYAASRWFEVQMERNFRSLGIVGSGRKGRINSLVKIPADVGEIDFLGFEPCKNLLVLAEAKMVSSGLEAKYWRDDVEAFVSGRKSYSVKFRKKIEWVRANITALRAALNLPDTVRIAPVMLTFYPCIARSFIDDFPCVSLTEFMLDYRQQNGWPYPLPSEIGG